MIYLMRGEVLLRSRNGGSRWDVSHSAGSMITQVAVDAADPDVVLVATTRRGVLRSTDGGETWRKANAGLVRLGRRWIMGVAADPGTPGAAYAMPWQGGVFQADFQD